MQTESSSDAGPDSPSGPPQPAGEIDFGVLPSLFGYHLRRAQVAVFHHWSAAIRAINITPGQAGVLIVISRNPGLTQAALARAMGIEKPTMLEVVDKLDRVGFIERRPFPNDRRSRALHLTALGERFAVELATLLLDHERRMMEGFAPQEREQLMAFLKRLSQIKP
ncbi:MAG TPA: MarR family winged helix-turn-helix transcriptional regulator [Stellaceae bacterium]|jgi:DNA-binding MarR family transcriptional regulator